MDELIKQAIRNIEEKMQSGTLGYLSEQDLTVYALLKIYEKLESLESIDNNLTRLFAYIQD